jgi:uncharacterized protein YceH (UPF0502 family)
MSDEPIQGPPITSLSKAQRRVFGVLLEKSFTTPEYYPMTLKAVTTGCNQKSNRDPLTNYSEDDAAEALDQLRELALVAVVHTESGRTERFRHYARKRFTFTEPQLAVMTELLLRGRQSLGELRARASRMVAIDSLEQLREALDGLQAMNYIQATGGLDRRGVEVDHNLYEPREGRRVEKSPDAAPPPASVPVSRAAVEPPHPPPGTVPAPADEAHLLSTLERTCAQLQQENRELREQLQSLAEQVREMGAQIGDLRQALGG